MSTVVLLDARARYVHPAFQMNRASTKTVFDSTGRLVTVPANALGWDHDPATGQSRGYLAEPSATNLLLHSNDLTQGAWSKFNASITGDAITGPDGNGMAKLVEDTSDNIHRLIQTFSITDGATVAFSPVLKAGERTRAVVYIMHHSDSANHARCTINLADGTISGAASSGTGALVDAEVMPLGSGFFRLALMGTLGSGVTNARVEVRLLGGTGSPSYAGDGTSGLYLGYCQAEEGSYPTSYIETGASTVTRARDSLILPDLGDFPWWRSDRGVLLVDVSVPTQPFFGEIMSLDLDLLIRRGLSGRVFLDGFRFAASPNDILSSSSAPGRHVIAPAWDGASITVAADGTITTTGDQTSALNESPNLGLGIRGNGDNAGLAHIHRAIYYPARPSNADLQSLTAIQE